MAGHLGNEESLLAALGRDERADLARLLRTLLAGLGDLPPGEAPGTAGRG
ncbi:hypothetical protein B0I33_11587 [Prauserella shujinwangii]|uniref:MarR family transcriptional regulator n=1 Tax=Prauserella shujinwangii TaxID=1453103 RepID=A0A2T0LKN7_9PSEU|nr:hypothetical protein [Prauserella shujinwangii]PRX43469.1 hypothetical protein B0I33_11587 [Prauserella shujinwangii]